MIEKNVLFGFDAEANSTLKISIAASCLYNIIPHKKQERAQEAIGER